MASLSVIESDIQVEKPGVMLDGSYRFCGVNFILKVAIFHRIEHGQDAYKYLTPEEALHQAVDVIDPDPSTRSETLRILRQLNEKKACAMRPSEVSS